MKEERQINNCGTRIRLNKEMEHQERNRRTTSSLIRSLNNTETNIEIFIANVSALYKPLITQNFNVPLRYALIAYLFVAILGVGKKQQTSKFTFFGVLF